MKGERELQLLVCSANLGNACPDVESFMHWVPDDGLCAEVVGPEPKYPVQMPEPASSSSRRFDNEEEEFADLESSDLFDSGSEFTEEDQFDIIVFGLQESTFDPPKDAAEDAMASLPNGVKEVVSQLGEPLIGAGGALLKTTKKTISQFQNITASRDHALTPKSKTNRLRNFASLGSMHYGDSTHSSGGGEGATTEPQQQWRGGTHVLHNLMQLRLPSYGRVVSFQRGEMRLVVCVHQDLLDSVEVVQVSAQNTGRAGLANKGGIVAELRVMGGTRLSFLTAHLEAHEGASKYATRVSTIADILAGTKEKQHDCSLTAHYSFVMGDLNFRTELPNHDKLEEEEHKRIVRDMAERQAWEALNEIDELGRALRNKECLVGFQTPLCYFPPTFKVERKPGFEYIDKRRPSYTDRILWKASHGLANKIKPLVYEPIDDFASSDHKPMRAAFTVKLNRSLKLRPKLARRRSVMNLGGFMSKKSAKNQHVAAYKERFHLFVSEFFCSISSEGKKSNPPNPYVCLISDPPGALQQKVRKGWKKVSHAVRNILGKDRLTTHYVTAKGWPRSSVQKQTFVANWHDEEIHSEVKTHTVDGIPIDLTGAMLRLTVMDSRSKTDDVVLGTVAFNLVNLIRSCRPSTAANMDDSRRHDAGREKKKKQKLSSGRESSDSVIRPGRRMSMFTSIFRKTGEDSVVGEGGGVGSGNDLDSVTDDPDPISTVEIDEPILKNGVETGRIHARVEAWWMDESMTKMMGNAGLSGVFGSNAPLNTRRKKRREIESSTVRVSGYGTTEDGRQVMLSARRMRPSVNKDGSERSTKVRWR